MNQESIGKFVKELRQEKNLTQKEFADKLGVTYQAVSKWENGKNIPDISLLKEISTIFNVSVEEILDGKRKEITKTTKKKRIMIPIICLFLLSIITVYLLIPKENSFEFKKIITTCKDFNISGSIAYNKSKTSIYISDITYCGEDNQTKYKKLECILYQSDKNIKTEISNYTYKENKEITLEEFLKNVNFNIDHYSKKCKMYHENSLYLEIKATTTLGKTEFYNIPLAFQENCNK